MDSKIRKIFKYYSVLSEEDLEYISLVVFNFSKIFGKLKMSYFLLFMNKSGICKFSITIQNSTLDNIIKRNLKQLVYNILLCQEIQKVFPEVFSNNHLSSEEKNYILETLSRELKSMIFYLYSDTKKNYYDCYNDNCVHEISLNKNIYRTSYKNQITVKEKSGLKCYELYEFIYLLTLNLIPDLENIDKIKKDFDLEVKIMKYIQI